MREKQEKQLQDYIRVNLRKVMLEQKENEAKEAEREKSLEEHAREARLESLRKYTRRKLGVDVMAPETGIKSYVKGLICCVRISEPPLFFLSKSAGKGKCVKGNYVDE